MRPPQARREKPRDSAFTSANIDKILALQPDLVLTFSDLQADIVAELIRRGSEVHAFNQRTVAGILEMIRIVGAMVGARERAPGNRLPDLLQAITGLSQRERPAGIADGLERRSADRRSSRVLRCGIGTGTVDKR